MRLLLATPLYPPEIGGPATYAQFMEEHLPKHGITITTLPFSSVRRLPRIVRHLAYAWKLLRLSRSADLIFAQDAFSAGLPALFVARLVRKPFIIRVPGDFAWEQGVARFGVCDNIETFQTRRYEWRLELLRTLQSWAARNADEIIVPSDFFKRIVLGWGVATEHVHRIYNPIGHISPENPTQSIPKPVLLSAGRLVEGKGFSTLVGLIRELPEWHVVIAGDGPLREALATHAKNLGVEDRTHLLGRISSASMRGWYDRADVFVLNTRFETFSFQVAEALSAGIPVVATNVGGIPELIENGKNGVLVDPDDVRALREAVQSVREDPLLWRERVREGKKVIERFDPEVIAKEVVSVLMRASSQR